MQFEFVAACPAIRLCLPFKSLEKHSDWRVHYAVSHGESDSAIGLDFQVSETDVLLFQRHFKLKDYRQVFQFILKNNIPIIFEVDDDFFNVPDDHPDVESIRKFHQNVLMLLNIADVVTVTSEELKEVYEPYCRRVEVIRNGIDPELWHRSPRASSGDTIILGYAGTPTHEEDLKMIEPALLKIMEEYKGTVELHLWGCVTEKLSQHPQVKCHFDEPLPYKTYVEEFQKFDLDIALAPLRDNIFNRGKSAIKWKEYAIGSVPGVYSKVPVYQRVVSEGEDGFVCSSDNEEWYQKIKSLIDDQKLREAMGRASRQKVLEHYHVDKIAQSWESLLNSVLQAHLKKEKLILPQVSVIIPVYNRSDLTRQCLDSIFKIGSSVDFEVIVVNNDSQDDTRQVLKDFEDRIRVLHFNENLGFSIANNRAADVALGEYLLMLNNDTVVTTGWIEALLTCQKEVSADLVGARLLYPNMSLQHGGIALYPHDGKPHALYAGLSSSDPHFEKLTGVRRRFQIVTAACWLVTKEMWEKLSGFDEDFVNGYEDVDLCLRVNEVGGRVFYEPSAKIIHYESQSPGRGAKTSHNEQLLFSRWRDKWVYDLELYLSEDGLQFDPNKGFVARENNFIEKNINLLVKKNTELAHRAALYREGWDRRRCELLPGPSVKIHHSSGDVTLHSSRNPAREAERSAEQCVLGFPGDGKIQVYGFGFAWHLEAILKKIPTNRPVEVQVVDLLVFRMALENRDLTELLSDPRLIIVTQMDGPSFVLPSYRRLLGTAVAS